MERVDRPFPGEHPDPPADFHARPLPIVLAVGPWYRLHGVNRAALYFGRTASSRFADPQRGYGVLYLADDEFRAFIETFGQVTGNFVVSWNSLASRAISRVSSVRALRLVDLTGPGLARSRADARLSSSDHSAAQCWSRAIWSHPDAVDGIRYRARHDDSRFAFAVFDRARDLLASASLGSLASPTNRKMVARMLDVYDFNVVDEA